jgi:hypothetical protein
MPYWNFRLAVAVGAALAVCGCAKKDDTSVIEAATISLQGEQVVMTPEQAICGEKEGLWKIEQTGYGATGRLTPAGRQLFADNVEMGDRRFSGPVVPMTGEGKLKVVQISNVTESTAVKVVTARVGVVLKHACFPDPLPLLGSDRGQFTEATEPQIRLRDDDGWVVDRILH